MVDIDIPDAPVLGVRRVEQPLFAREVRQRVAAPVAGSMALTTLGQARYAKYLAASEYRNAKRNTFRFHPHKQNIYNPRTQLVETGYGRYKRRFKFRKGGRRYYGYRTRRRYGRGGYWGDYFGRKLGGLIGVSGDTAGKFGSEAGDALQGRLMKWIPGFGAYNMRSSGYGEYIDDKVGATGVQDQDIPIMSNPGGTDGPVVIRHREYIGDIATTGSSFAIQYTLPINPALPGTFPWLATVANNFSQYRLMGLIFHFKSTSGALSTTQALGEIIMAVNYDTASPAFTNKSQMLNEVFAMSKVPSLDSECPVECDPSQTGGSGGLFYTRNGAVPSGQDSRFYDIGTFYIATQGQTAAVTLGELWVTYQIALYKPQLPAVSIGGGLQSCHYTSTTAVAATPLKGMVATYDSIGITVSNTSITFPEGSSGLYLVNVFWNGNSQAITAPILSLTNCTSPTGVSYPTPFNFYCPANAETSIRLVLCLLVSIASLNSGAVITFGAAGTIPTANTSSLTITQINASV
jgi:hypothetical protein